MGKEDPGDMSRDLPPVDAPAGTPLSPAVPYSVACERNQEPILQILRLWFVAPGMALEVGSGTGQHATHFAKHLPHLTWQPTDREENLPAIRARVQQAGLGNLNMPIELDVAADHWPAEQVRYVFSANTAHIMSWQHVEAMFAGIGRLLQTQGCLLLYGPFNRDGQFTSESNQAFDQMLRDRDPAMGVRDDQAMIQLGRQHGLEFGAEYEMPACNRILVWTKR